MGLQMWDVMGPSCSVARPECDFWRLDQAQTDCDGNRFRKRFAYTIKNHCEGMTYEIKLSAVLPNGGNLNDEPPLCEVYEDARITTQGSSSGSLGGGLAGVGS